MMTTWQIRVGAYIPLKCSALKVMYGRRITSGKATYHVVKAEKDIDSTNNNVAHE